MIQFQHSLRKIHVHTLALDVHPGQICLGERDEVLFCAGLYHKQRRVTGAELYVRDAPDFRATIEYRAADEVANVKFARRQRQAFSTRHLNFATDQGFRLRNAIHSAELEHHQPLVWPATLHHQLAAAAVPIQSEHAETAVKAFLGPGVQFCRDLAAPSLGAKHARETDESTLVGGFRGSYSRISNV